MLGHNYMEPLVFGLSEKEEQGDSLGLSMFAAKTEAPYLIFNGCAIHGRNSENIESGTKQY